MAPVTSKSCKRSQVLGYPLMFPGQTLNLNTGSFLGCSHPHCLIAMASVM